MGNVIEINGKKYDAATGKLLSSAHHKSAEHRKKSTTQVSGSMDGMTARKPAARRVRSSTAHAPKQLQKSQTLMRTVVSKPKSTPKPVQSTISKSHLGTTEARTRTAAQTKQSPLVSRFGTTEPQPSSVVKKIGHLPVKQPSAAHTGRAYSSQPPHHAPPHIGIAQHTRAATPTARTKNVAAAKLIETALANADAHEQPLHHKPKRHHKIAKKLGVSARAVALSSTVLAGVLLGGFFAVQNVPNLSMRVAATRAGFDATMPSYSPSGFSFNGPINYSPGQVTVSFRSNTDERHYNLTQRSSNWNSEALLSNFVADNGQAYQAYEDNRGRTLFIYGVANATWVDNGIWYQIEGDSQMTTDQISRIAASM